MECDAFVSSYLLKRLTFRGFSEQFRIYGRSSVRQWYPTLLSWYPQNVLLCDGVLLQTT